MWLLARLASLPARLPFRISFPCILPAIGLIMDSPPPITTFKAARTGTRRWDQTKAVNCACPAASAFEWLNSFSPPFVHTHITPDFSNAKSVAVDASTRLVRLPLQGKACLPSKTEGKAKPPRIPSTVPTDTKASRSGAEVPARSLRSSACGSGSTRESRGRASRRKSRRRRSRGATSAPACPGSRSGSRSSSCRWGLMI